MKISSMTFIIDTNCTNDKYLILKEQILKNSIVYMNGEAIANIVKVEYIKCNVYVTIEMIPTKELSWLEISNTQIGISSRDQIQLEK